MKVVLSDGSQLNDEYYGSGVDDTFKGNGGDDYFDGGLELISLSSLEIKVTYNNSWVCPISSS